MTRRSRSGSPLLARPRAGAERNTDNPFEQTMTAANASSLKVIWSANTGGQFVSSPVVSDVGVHVNAVVNNGHSLRAV